MNMPCRLIHASRLAYAISADGKKFKSKTIDVDTEISGAGLDKTSLKIFQSPENDGIDACYYGRTTDGAGVLAFRGTLPPSLDGKDANDFLRILLDWLNDAEIAQVKGSNLPGRVHKGFLDSLDNLWGGITCFGIDKSIPLYITGHSKGGGLTFLAASRWLNEIKTRPAGVFTFAAPRVGNQQFALAYDAAMKDVTQRYEYQDDLVPHLPPHTGAWLQSLKAGQAVSGRIAAFAPDVLSLAQKPGFDALLKRMEQILEKIQDHRDLMESYVSAGTLRFINWDKPPKAAPDSWGLSVKRDFHLAELLATFQFPRIIKDHSSDGGYLTCPCGLPPTS